MSTHIETPQVASILALIDSLEPGERRLLHEVSWEDYEQLLEELGEGYAVRVSYAEGTLEIMAPLYRHEHAKDSITALARVLTKALGLKLESAGSTTLKRKRLRRGAEPDTCFYIQHAAQVIGKQTIDLRVDPPPDIVVEVDVTHPSYSKLKTYARFGVPEFWRYDGKRFEIFALVSGGYVARETSVTFPFVRSSDLMIFLEQSQTEGQDAALQSFEAWLSTHKPTR